MGCKRYDTTAQFCDVEESADGKYVLYEDYARLELELARLRYKYWQTCDNEGLGWYEPIPPNPDEGVAP